MWHVTLGAFVVSSIVGSASIAQPFARLDIAAERSRSYLDSDRGRSRLDTAASVLHDRMGVGLEPDEISQRIAHFVDEGRAAAFAHVLHQWSVVPALPDGAARFHLTQCPACSEVARGAASLPFLQSLRVPDAFTREQPLRERVLRLSRVAFDALPIEALDLDGDGSLETVVADVDGDGLLDRCRVDLTGDGVADLDFHVESGEWRVRRPSPWEALGPCGALEAIRDSGVLPASLFAPHSAEDHGFF